MSQGDLFGGSASSPSMPSMAVKHPVEQSGNTSPLAARMRPSTLEDYVGQEHIMAPGKLLRRSIEADRIQSLILYGHPEPAKRPWLKSLPTTPSPILNDSVGSSRTWRKCAAPWPPPLSGLRQPVNPHFSSWTKSIGSTNHNRMCSFPMSKAASSSSLGRQRTILFLCQCTACFPFTNLRTATLGCRVLEATFETCPRR